MDLLHGLDNIAIANPEVIAEEDKGMGM